MEEDLRICLVRPLTDGDRRFCFEVAWSVALAKASRFLFPASKKGSEVKTFFQVLALVIADIVKKVTKLS